MLSVRKDFEDDIRQIQKMRARDKTDNEIRIQQMDYQLAKQSKEFFMQKEYFN